jgi:hypothetical protein
MHLLITQGLNDAPYSEIIAMSGVDLQSEVPIRLWNWLEGLSPERPNQ